MVSKRKIKVDTKLLFEQPITLIKRRDLVTFNNPVHKIYKMDQKPF